MNKKTLKTLEYTKVIDLLINYACCDSAKQMCRELLPMTDKEEIKHNTARNTASDFFIVFIFHPPSAFQNIYQL